jgi:hypothetical protein
MYIVGYLINIAENQHSILTALAGACGFIQKALERYTYARVLVRTQSRISVSYCPLCIS